MAKFNSREQFAQYNRYFSQLKDTYDNQPVVRESLHLLLSLLTISFLVLFALRPTINTISELYAKVRLQQEVSEKLDTKIQALSQAKIVWDKEQSRILLISQALPDKPQPEAFLQQIEGLASINNVTLGAFEEGNTLLAGKDLRKPEQRTDDSKKKDLPSTKSTSFSFTISGDYTNIKAFLRELENLRSQSVIQSYTMSINNSSAKAAITLKLAGNIPFLDLESLKDNEKEKL